MKDFLDDLMEFEEEFGVGCSVTDKDSDPDLPSPSFDKENLTIDQQEENDDGNRSTQ